MEQESDKGNKEMANPAALQDAYEKGIIHSDFLIRCFGETGILFGGETKPVQNSLGNNETINKTVETLELPMAFDPAALVDQIALREVSRIQGKLF